MVADYSLLGVAQEYLRCAPIVDIVTMWWTTAVERTASVESAQQFHFDMDRIKWLKVFIYLTDVTPENGPHCFISGTHRRYSQPRELLKRGYNRILDEDVRKYFEPERFKEFTGPRGTIIFEDTRGFHKGKPAEKGDRLVMEIEYTDSLFGISPPRIPVQPCHPQFVQMWNEHPKVFARFRRLPSADSQIARDADAVAVDGRS